jgi:hypothetical protein
MEGGLRLTRAEQAQERTRRASSKCPSILCSPVTLRLTLGAAALACASLCLSAQVGALQQKTPSAAKLPEPASASLSSVPPRDWAVDASNNEIPIIERSSTYLRYRMHIVDEKGVMLRDVIESKDGSVARLIERDDRPLTEEEDKAEQERLNDLLASPGAYMKHVSNDASGKKRAADMIRLLPDAMLYSYTPGQPQIDHASGQQVVLDFKPNPAWRPPNTTAEALTGLQGRVWVDVKTHHMIRMEGDIFQGVNLGWGMLAHIFPGGRLSIEQTQVGQRWIFTKFTEQITVRALMVKTIRQNAIVNTTGHTPINQMGYQDAIRTLLATPLPK